VAVPGKDERLCVELALEHFADRVEAGMMRTGDHELRRRGCTEGLEWDLCLPRPALDDERARILLELRREGRRGSQAEPTARRNPRKKPSGSSLGPSAQWSIPPFAKKSAAGLPRATCVAGGSTTTSEPRGCDSTGSVDEGVGHAGQTWY
jgi:hypothetical protein